MLSNFNLYKISISIPTLINWISLNFLISSRLKLWGGTDAMCCIISIFNRRGKINIFFKDDWAWSSEREEKLKSIFRVLPLEKESRKRIFETSLKVLKEFLKDHKVKILCVVIWIFYDRKLFFDSFGDILPFVKV